MAFTRRTSRVIVLTGGAGLLLAAMWSLAQGSSPTDWDLVHGVQALPGHLGHLRADLHAAADAAAEAVDPYWHAAADAADPIFKSAAEAVDPYLHAAADAADPIFKSAADNVRSAAGVVDPYLHGAVDASHGVLKTAADAAGGLVRQGLEVMKPYVDEEVYDLMASVTRPSDPDPVHEEEEVRGGGDTPDGRTGAPEGESTLGQWVGREAETPAFEAGEPPEPPESSTAVLAFTTRAARGRSESDGDLAARAGDRDGAALASPLRAAAVPRAVTKTKVPPRALSGRTCARAFVEDSGGCKKVIKLPECAGSPYGGKYWTVSKAAVKADPGNRHFKGLSSSLMSALPATSPFDGEPFESCALVSSGRDMLKRKQGALIDSHAVVMRINGAPTKGFEQYVGKRTTFRLTHSGYFGWREKEHEVLVGKWPGGRSADELRKMAKYKVHAMNPSFVMASRSAWFTKRGHLPTQGMRGLLLLLGSCKQVSIFGFEGGTAWYFDKVRNRLIDGPLGKRAHGWGRERRQWPKTQVLATRRRRGLLAADETWNDGGRAEGAYAGGQGPRRRLTGLPTTHIIKVERECMNNFVRAGIVKRPRA